MDLHQSLSVGGPKQFGLASAKFVRAARMIRSAVVALLAAAVLWTGASPGAAEPRPATSFTPDASWKSLSESKLIVVARFEGLVDERVALRVIRVLRGERTLAKDVVLARLLNGYEVEVFVDGLRMAEGIERRIVRLNYEGRGDPTDMGGNQRVAAEDLNQPAIYFFSHETYPALDSVGQVQPPGLEEGWHAVLQGKEPPLAFQLAQTVDRKKAAAALEELTKTRDRETIKKLIEWLCVPSSVWGFDPFRALARLGDKDGDVYGPLLALLKSGVKCEGQAPQRVARTMARVGGKRALTELDRMISDGSNFEKSVAAQALCYTGTREGVEKAFRLLRDPYLSGPALESIEEVLHGDAARLPGLERTRLREVAVSLAREAIESPALSWHHKQRLQARFGEK